MYKKAAKFALISCGVFIFSNGANAVPITFDFSGGGANAMVLPFTDAGTGVSISVRGRNITDGTAALVTWNNNGLGVRSDDEIGVSGGGTGQLDSFGDNERINFNIADLGIYTGLELVSIDFWNIDLTPPNTDDFGVRFDGVNPFAGTGIGNSFTPGSNPWIAALDLDASSDQRDGGRSACTAGCRC